MVAYFFMLLCVVIVPTARAGVAFSETPPGGWDYTFEGSSDAFGTGEFTALDGTWSHDEGDRWDGSAPGSGAPGGVDALVDGNTTFLRIQDPGDPTVYGIPNPSNSRVHFGHDIRATLGNVDAAVLDNGITLSFRARLAIDDPNDPTDPPLDDVYDEDTPPTTDPWPTTGKGYEVYGGGRGMFGVSQMRSSGFEGQISFSMIKSDEGSEFGLASGGLTMNNLTDNATPLAVNTNDPGTKNVVEIDDAALVDWREFWITIVEDEDDDPATATDTHRVDIFMDGSGARNSFYVTEAIQQNEILYGGSAFLLFGMNSESRWGAMDVDFYSFKSGLFYPGPPGDMDFDGDVDFDDIGDFVLGLNNPALYESTHSVPPEYRGDIDGDGDADFDDIQPFVNILTNPGQSGSGKMIPEPTTLALVFVVCCGFAVRVSRTPLRSIFRGQE